MNPTCHLHAPPAVILRTLYSTVERTYRGSCHRIYHRSIPESRHPSHSDIDIIIDCFSVNHGLPAFLMYYSFYFFQSNSKTSLNIQNVEYESNIRPILSGNASHCSSNKIVCLCKYPWSPVSSHIYPNGLLSSIMVSCLSISALPSMVCCILPYLPQCLWSPISNLIYPTLHGFLCLTIFTPLSRAVEPQTQRNSCTSWSRRMIVCSETSWTASRSCLPCSV